MMRRRYLNEDLTKNDVNSIVSSKISDAYNSRDFENKVKEITSKVVEELFHVLWQQSNTWRGRISR